MLKIFVVAVAFCCVLTSTRQVNASCKKCYGKPCIQNPKERVVCGRDGKTTNKECINKYGCCWDDKITPHCFRPGEPCSVNMNKRVPCGEPTAITNQECIKTYGCCWDNNNKPHCFCPAGQ